MSVRQAYRFDSWQPRHISREPWFWISAVAISAALVYVFFWPTQTLRWGTNWQVNFLQTFTALAVVSVFIERVVEVFVGLWQDPRVDVHFQQLEMEEAVQVNRQAEIKRLSAKLTEPNLEEADKQKIRDEVRKREQELHDSEAAAENLQRELVVFRAATRQIATWSGLLAGVLVATVGFRILGNVVDLASIAPAADNAQGYSRQFQWFVVVDILLTAAVLAGGSQAIHKLFNVFDTIMETSQSIAQKRKLTQATPPVPPAGGR